MLGDLRPTPRLADTAGVARKPGAARCPRSLDASPHDAQPTHTPAATAVSMTAERRRLERDLHDGVQNELVVLIVKLALARQDPRTPPALADVLAGLEARAQAALDFVRDIAHGIYPPLLTSLGVTDALRAQAARAAIRVSVAGRVARSSEEAEEAVYFCCSEAIQNAAKHAGGTARVKLSLDQHHGTLAVRIADDGRGFDQAHTARGIGLQNIRARVEDLGGIFNIASNPGSGTLLTFSLPWPTRAGRA